MIDKETLATAPLPLLKYIGEGKFEQGELSKKSSALTYWLFYDNGTSYQLEWWTNGWVIYFKENYLCKDLLFKYKLDIMSFDFSYFGSSKGWHHVFQTKEDAIKTFINYWNKTYNNDFGDDYVDSVIEF